MKSTKRKITWLSLFRIVLFFAPLTALIIVNREDYFKLATGTVFPQYIETTIGGALAIGVFALITLKRTNLLKGSLGLWIATGISFFLSAIIKDLTWILLSVAAGSTVWNWFEPKIVDLKIIYQFEKQANIQAQAMKTAGIFQGVGNINNNVGNEELENRGGGRV